MTSMTLFDSSNLVILPFWLLMVLLPHWTVTRTVMSSVWIVAPPALIYVIALLPVFGYVMPVVVQPQLAAVASLLGTPTGATVAWAHFVALDLFVGRWVYLDSRARGFSAWWVSPVLVLCLLLCPAGLLLYLGVRAVLGGAHAPHAMA